MERQTTKVTGPYLLRGRFHCGLCERKMQGTTIRNLYYQADALLRVTSTSDWHTRRAGVGGAGDPARAHREPDPRLPTRPRARRLGRPPSLLDIGRHDVVNYTPVTARYLQELVISRFHGAGVEPRYVQQVGQVHSLLALVDAGVGVGLVPRSAARPRLPNLAFTVIAGLAPDIVETHGVWRGEHNNPALDSLLRLTEAAA